MSALFYRYDERWLNTSRKDVDWEQIKLIVFLNHTSLFEPIFLRLAPNHFLWKASKQLIIPGADITLKRPLVGRFFHFLLPGVIPITRKKDHSWRSFLEAINSKSIVAILPEGRMMRPNGLDKSGKQMSVRGGIADILSRLKEGSALFIYSGGLHHIQVPGQKLPKLFKQVRVNLEVLNIAQYKKSIGNVNFEDFKSKLVKDLNHRLAHRVPKQEQR
ncbi:1-acyl-sn-glycerol-3-phosphate acyltransferase [Aliikangiella sp. G2MR2-5]|uniref:1-acyl-sn-glycerol-3-phosphate acyltransferase n=1 Tax=Aliikangiella sp. G2MR2-5 TaxID=2788943 RepID=UPI0018A9B412